MTLNIRNVLIGILAVVFGSYALYVITQQAYGAITIDQNASANLYRTYDFFASTTAASGVVSTTVLATTTSATSTNIAAFTDTTYGRYVNGAFDITGAKKVTLYFGRGGATSANTGTTTYKVQTTKDGTNWNDYDHLKRITTVTTGDTYFTRVSSTNSGASLTNTGSATSTLIYAMDLDYSSYNAIRCIVVEEANGEHQCAASASF